MAEAPVEHKGLAAVGQIILKFPGLRGTLTRDKATGEEVVTTNLEEPGILEKVVKKMDTAVANPEDVDHVSFKAFEELESDVKEGRKKALFRIVGGTIVVTMGAAVALVGLEKKREWQDVKKIYNLIHQHKGGTSK